MSKQKFLNSSDIDWSKIKPYKVKTEPEPIPEEEPSFLQKSIDTFKRIDEEVTQPVQQKFEQAIGQMGTNPLAGGLNLLNALGGAMAVPFMTLDKVARLNSFTEKIADVVNKPFEVAGQVGSAVMPTKEQLDQMLMVNNIILSNEALQETSEALDELGGMGAMFALGGGVAKGVKTIKKGFTPKEVAEVKTKIEPKVEPKIEPKAEPKEYDFNLKEIKNKKVKGLTQEKLPLDLAEKIDVGDVGLDKLTDLPKEKPKIAEEIKAPEIQSTSANIEQVKNENIIYTTKQPNMWQTQLGQERGSKSPEYLYLAEVKNPSKESGYYGHETASPIEEVKIVKKLGKDLELTKGKDEPVDLGSLEELREQYAKENNIPLENVEYHWSNKKDLIRGENISQPKAGEGVIKTEPPLQRRASTFTEKKVIEPKVEETPKGVVTDRIAQLRKEALDEYKNRSSELTSGFNPTNYKKTIELGAEYVKQGIKDFTQWSKQMITDFGEKIKPYLLQIWDGVKKLAKGEVALFKQNELGVGAQLKSPKDIVRELATFKPKEKLKPDSPLAKELGKNEVTPVEENIKKIRTADYYQKLLSQLPEGRKEQKTILKEAVEENPQRIKYNIFKPANLGKEVNPLIRGAYQLLFDKRELFKKDLGKFEQESNALIRKARQSRGHQLVRQDTQVIDYLEGKTKLESLTKPEQELATYLRKWFKDVEPVMTNKNARENYVTHVKRGFLETWKQEGFWEGAKNLFKETDKNWESQVIADIDLMMAKEKFNPFAITRKGGMPYTKDLGKILETYGKIFFLKKHFDTVRPGINMLNNILGKEGMIPEKNFLKRYTKKMVGENIDNLTPPMLKKVSSALVKFTGMRFLAWNIPAGIINTAAGITDNFIYLKTKEVFAGNKRFETKQGQKIIKDNNVVDVENLEGAIGLRQQIGKSLDMLLFLPMRGGWRLPWGEHYIQGSAYLGMLTKQEFNSGKVTLARHREILEKVGNIHGAYRDNLAPDAKQTIGTREALQFKLWMFAKVRNRWNTYGEGIVKSLIKKEAVKPEVLRTAAKELGVISAGILLMSDDNNPIKDKIEDLASDLYGSLNPLEYKQMLRRGIPAVGTLVDLAEAVEAYLTQEKYKTSNKKFNIKKGDLKAPKKLERLIPLYRQFNRPQETEQSPQIYKRNNNESRTYTR